MMKNHSNEKGQPTKNQTVDIPVKAVTYKEIDRLEKEVLSRFQAEEEKSTANAGIIALREASSLGQGGYGKVDEHSGSYAYSIEVNVPPPRNGGPKPCISMVYNSMRSGAASLMGMGWRLELGRIERHSLRGNRVDFKNNQGDEDPNDHFILKLNGKTYTMASVYGQPNQFRIKIEESFARAYRYPSTKIDPISNEPEIDHWLVVLADGTKYRYGIPEKAGLEEMAGELRNKIWNIITIEDTYGRKVLYEYEAYCFKKNPNWEEMIYTYPIRVKSGVTGDESFWDSMVEFVYEKKQPEDPYEGYYNLGEDYTGREYEGPKTGYTCMIWKRLREIRTFYRDEKGNFLPNRDLLIYAEEEFGKFKVAKVDEQAYKNGKLDTTAQLPPHTFLYEFKDPSNPAVMKKSVSPMNKVEKISYGLASQVDQGTPHALDNTYLVVSYTESTGEESWTKGFQYWDGQNYTPFKEFRGHRRSDMTDNETGMRTENYFIQTGVHNGSLMEQIKYDTEGNKISHLENNWMALDYKGGRYMPFKQKAITRKYAENGLTVISTEVDEVPKDVNGQTPWQYVLDSYGNPLVQIKTTYEGDLEDGKIVLQNKTETTYKNVETETIRLIGLPIKTIKYARLAKKDKFLLSQWEEKDYNEKGQVIETRKRYHRKDAQKLYIETNQYHPQNGQLTFKHRFNGSRKILVEENRYYESGGYRFLKSHTFNALKQVDHTVAYDLQVNKASKVTRLDGTTAKTSFDGLGRTTQELFICQEPSTREGNNDSVSYTYTITPVERCTETHFIHTGARKIEYFDPLNRKYKEITTGFKGRRIIKEAAVFDHKSREPGRINEPHYEDEACLGVHVKEYADNRLRLTTERFPGGKVVRTRYNGFTTTREEDVYLLDQEGKMGPLQRTQLLEEEVKNAMDQVVKQASGQPGTEGHYEIYLHYDAQGRKVIITDSKGLVLMSTDFASRLDDKAVSTIDAALGKMEMEYDGMGRVIRKRRDFKGQLDRTISMTYDHLDRITKQTDHDTHDGATQVMTCQYDSASFGVGKPALRTLKETNNLGTFVHEKRFAYNHFGFPSAVDHRWDIQWQTIGIKKTLKAHADFEHNGQKGGRLEFLSYPSINGIEGGTAEYIYDDISRLLTGIRFNDQPVWQVPQGAFNARKKEEQVNYGNGLTGNFLYHNASGRLTGTDTTLTGDLRQRYRLQYDSSANVTQQHIETAANGTDRKNIVSSHSFTYDDKNQLVAAQLDNNEQLFKYKANGSRTHLMDRNAETNYHYHSDIPHRLDALTGAKERQFSYDNAGNMILDKNRQTGCSREFKWNPANTLQQVDFLKAEGQVARSLIFGYDGQMNRILKYDSHNHTLVLYMDNIFELQLDLKAEQTELRSHILNNTRRIVTFKQSAGQSSAMSYYHRDLLTSVMLVTGADGAILDAPNYEPFGKATHTDAQALPDILYTGHRADIGEYLGFCQYDFKARTYDPELGLFISPDEAKDSNNAAFGFNRYIYVNNNPISKWDPNGNEGEDGNGFVQIENGFFIDFWNPQWGVIAGGYEIPVSDILPGYRNFTNWMNSPSEPSFDVQQAMNFGNNASSFWGQPNFQNPFNFNNMPRQQFNQNNPAQPAPVIRTFLSQPLDLSPQTIRDAFPSPFGHIDTSFDHKEVDVDREMRNLRAGDRGMFELSMDGYSSNEIMDITRSRQERKDRFKFNFMGED
jgi:RHS repeat-associated protein